MNELEKKFRLDLDEKAQSFLDDQNAIYFRNGANWAFQWFSRQQQWVSVKERLPEEGTQVIVLLEFETEEPETICAGYDDIGFFNLEDRTHYWTNVTRWMPLPEPPK